MTVITNATPKANLLGIQDKSRPDAVIQPEQIPQHLPHIYLFTERGDTLPHIVIGDSLNRLYGSASLDFRKKFATHQTVLASAIQARGNMMMVQRLQPDDAETALLRLSVEVIRTKLATYQRTTAGQFALDSAGDKIVTTPANVEGFRVIWHINHPSHTQAFGLAATVASLRAGDAIVGLSSYGATATSTLYPIADLEVASFGSYGNRVGLRLSAPNALSADPGDVSAMFSRSAYLYRFKFVERPENQTTPNIINTNLGETSVDRTFVDNVTHPIFDTDISVDTNLIEAYQDFDTPNQPPKYAPFGRKHMYSTEMATVLELLRAGTATYGGVAVAAPGEGSYDALCGRTNANELLATVGNVNLLNLVTGIDPQGVPYQSVTMDGSVTYGGTALGETSYVYAAGGDDGLSDSDVLDNLRIYDGLVANQVANYGDLEAHMLDDAKYPVSIIWDSGFSIETKKKLLVPIGRRKDLCVGLATQAVAEYADPLTPLAIEWEYMPANSISEDSAMALALRTAAANYPESDTYGTAACRAFIVGHAGKLLNSSYKGMLPLTIDLAEKFARYMGAGDGRWTTGQSFDENPGNTVTSFKDVNNIWKTPAAYNADWANGLIWVQNFDTRSQFYPGLQTVYPDDNSVLNSLMVVLAATELEKVSQRVWREMTGNSRWTVEQFIEESNKRIVEKTQGRFDGRFIIQPETFFTAADAARGYSWSVNIHLYANTMKTVGTFTIVARRTEDFQAA
jgi:hypothetical protein